MTQIPTGIRELDVVLNGGLDTGAVVLVIGAPGAGKTILAQQTCFAMASEQHKAIYYTTTSEPQTKLVRHLEQFDFFDTGALGPIVEYIHLGAFLAGSRMKGLEPLVSEIVRETVSQQPAIVVIDSVKMLQDYADEREFREAMYDLTDRFTRTGAILVLLGAYTPEELRRNVVFSLADVIIQLEYETREPLDRRSLRVVKKRGGSHRPGRHTFRIGQAGVEVFPRVETLIPESEAPLSSQIPSGIPGLDELMGGGAQQGDASLVTGPSGVGKTIFAIGWLMQGLEREENCLYVTVQDTRAQLTSVAAGFGWDIAHHRDSGRLVISHLPMGDLDLDVLATSVRAEINRRHVSRVVIDSLTELVFAAREEPRFAAYVRSLIGLIRAAGTSLLLTSETDLHGLANHTLDRLMFLFDNTIDLRYVEEGAQIGRALHVAKMRSRAHATTLNRVRVTSNGLQVGEVIENVTGRLGWSALNSPLELPSERLLPSNGART